MNKIDYKEFRATLSEVVTQLLSDFCFSFVQTKPICNSSILFVDLVCIGSLSSIPLVYRKYLRTLPVDYYVMYPKLIAFFGSP